MRLGRTAGGVALAALAAPAATAHEGELVRGVEASARPTDEGGVALDVLSTLSLPRTASMLVLAQLDLNHDGRFDGLERAFAEAALGPRAESGLAVGPSGAFSPPADRQVAVQLDPRGVHVAVAVLETWRLPAGGEVWLRFGGPGEALELPLSVAPGLTLEGPVRPRLLAGAPAVRLALRPNPPAAP